MLIEKGFGISAVIAALCGSAGGASVVIHGPDTGTLQLDAGVMSDVFDEPSFISGYFTQADLETAHGHLAGIDTDAAVTFLLAETAAGLSLMALVDEETGAGLGLPDSVLSVHSVAPSGTSYFSNGLLDPIDVVDVGDERIADAVYMWNGDHHGDAFAWAGLSIGDGGDLSLGAYDLGVLGTVEAVQFATWSGDAWEIVATTDFGAGSFQFQFGIIPVPPALPMGLAGLLGVIVWRKVRGWGLGMRR